MRFSSRIVEWQISHGRHDFPWQGKRNPYFIWVSEIMLQQTQVSTVVPYYQRFVHRFPTIRSLAAASLDDVLAHWSGLGYYARARNLHQAAQMIVDHCRGRFPKRYEDVCQLSGVGKSTAAAICVFAFGQRYAILDGNVKRVLARYFGISGSPSKIERVLWKKARALLPNIQIERYTQGLMDHGAMICTRRHPQCTRCPVSARCVALRINKIPVLPTPKPKKTLPRKQIIMLVLWCKHQILLERRAPCGIWGGLWSLPEAALHEDVSARCEREFGVQVRGFESLPEIEHGFTHFKLRITPKLIRLESIQLGVAQYGNAWFSVADALGAAIPAPVRKILSQFQGRIQGASD